MLVSNPKKQKLSIQVKDALGFADLPIGRGEVCIMYYVFLYNAKSIWVMFYFFLYLLVLYIIHSLLCIDTTISCWFFETCC
jgi:hypothetical protein